MQKKYNTVPDIELVQPDFSFFLTGMSGKEKIDYRVARDGLEAEVIKSPNMEK